jgi:E3 ubiquitin-protein ligase Topors
MQWSQVNQQCPLCKADFISLIYDVKNEAEYKRYYLRDQEQKQNQQTTSTSTSSGRKVDFVAEYNSRYGKRGATSSPPVISNPNLPFSTAHSLRRAVYVRGLRAVPIVSSKLPLKFTPAALSANESFWHGKLKSWLTRELQAVLEEEDVDLLVVFILSMLSKKDIQSKEVRDQLAEWLFDYVDTFIHELTCFAQSPYDMINYDKHVQYDYSHATSSRSRPNKKLQQTEANNSSGKTTASIKSDPSTTGKF